MSAASSDSLHPTSREPELCHVCGRHAIGVGFSDRDTNRWLCAECYPLLEYVKSVRRWDGYEQKAVEDSIAAAGGALDKIGKTDLAEMDDVEARMLATAFVRGHQDGIRRAIKSGPF